MGDQGKTALLELQGIDTELTRAAKQLDELPEKREILVARTKVREAQALHEKAELLVRKLEAEVRARRDEVATLTQKMESEQARMMATTDHRQVQSISREMDGFRRRADKVEMESRQFQERVDKAREQVLTVEEHIERLKTVEAEAIERYRTAGGALQRRIKELEDARAATSPRVDGELLAKYDTIRASKGGIGVGRLEGEMCTACRMALPAERLRELAAGPDVSICPQCRRLIVVRSESDS